MRLLLILLCASLFVCGRPSVPGAAPPNVLLLIADDWSYPHAGVYGDAVVRTPTFDRLAAEGVLFTNAYCAAPSCTPSRGAILTGRYPHQLGEAGNLWSVLQDSIPNYVSLLARAGYRTGSSRKGWAPGDFAQGGYEHQPAGPQYPGFADFLAELDPAESFCFWMGSTDPHRVYDPNTGLQAGMNLEDVTVPGFLPDEPCVRNDILDYYYEVERFDRDCGEIIRQLEAAGRLDNTIVVITSDNGMPFPRAKANLYDYGTRVPLLIRWPEAIPAGTVVNDFVNLIDLAPTFLAAAGVESPRPLNGRDLLAYLRGESQDRSRVFLERERHAQVRAGNLSYPMRAVRDSQYLYIRNPEPDRWPAGDPQTVLSVGQYGDVDNSITKFLVLDRAGTTEPVDYFSLAFAKRPAEELYDIIADPYQLDNLAGRPAYAAVQSERAAQLQDWMERTGDRRATGPTDFWDRAEYTPSYGKSPDFDVAEAIDSYRIQPYNDWYQPLPQIGCREAGEKR
jgi:arylsulfatase A-like enzyme